MVLVPAAVERGEVWGRRPSIAKFRSTDMGLRRPLAAIFRAGGIVLFIPWRVVAEESGAADPGRRCWPTAGAPPISI